MLDKYLLKEIPLCDGVCLLGAMRYDHRDSNRQDYGKGLYFRSNDSSVLFRFTKVDSINFIKAIQHCLSNKSALSGFSFSHGINLKPGTDIHNRYIPHVQGNYIDNADEVQLTIKQGLYAFRCTLPSKAVDFHEYLALVLDDLQNETPIVKNNVVTLTPNKNNHTLLK